MPQRRERKEETLQTAVSTYLKLQHPNIVFTSESSGIRVPMWTAVQMKNQRSNHKLPDLIVLEPRKGYHGLIMELKKDRKELYLKDGGLRKLEHIQEQNKTLELLSEKGYRATFACGIDECLTIIKEYLS